MALSSPSSSPFKENMHIIEYKTLIFLKFLSFYLSSSFKANISIAYKQRKLMHKC